MAEIRAEMEARNDAYFLCRQTSLKEADASYAEQFEGLYALMRGLPECFRFADRRVVKWRDEVRSADRYEGGTSQISTFRLLMPI